MILLNINIWTRIIDKSLELCYTNVNSSVTVFQVPFRMLVVKLTGHVYAVTMCGPTPTLTEIIRLASSSWAPVYQVLESITTLLPWNIAPGLLSQIDHSVIG